MHASKSFLTHDITLGASEPLNSRSQNQTNPHPKQEEAAGSPSRTPVLAPLSRVYLGNQRGPVIPYIKGTTAGSFPGDPITLQGISYKDKLVSKWFRLGRYKIT